MNENLLEAPEREIIEALLTKSSECFGHSQTFERVLGFITGAVITPDVFDPSDWLQPLFDLNGIALLDVEDIELFTQSVMSLYDRVDAMKSRGERLCPFDLGSVELTSAPQPAFDWAKGLHLAVTSQEDIWIPYEGEADFIDDKLKDEVNLHVQVLATLVDPASIPNIVKDPIPFQRNFLSECPSWQKELRESWDEELITIFRYYCLGKLDAIMDSLQRYAAVYDEPAVFGGGEGPGYE